MANYYQKSKLEGIRLFGMIFLFEHNSSRAFNDLKQYQTSTLNSQVISTSSNESPQEIYFEGELTPHFLTNILSPYLDSLTDLQFIIDSLRDSTQSPVIINNIASKLVIDETTTHMIPSDQMPLIDSDDKQAKHMLSELETEHIEISTIKHRVIMSGDQNIISLEINGDQNQDLIELINTAIRRSQKLAAEKLLGFSKPVDLFTSNTVSLGKIREQAIEMQRQLQSEFIEINENNFRIVMAGDQKVTALEINGIENYELLETLNRAIKESQSLAAKKLMMFSKNLYPDRADLDD